MIKNCNGKERPAAGWCRGESGLNECAELFGENMHAVTSDGHFIRFEKNTQFGVIP
jgi:hypothetical protein